MVVLEKNFKFLRIILYNVKRKNKLKKIKGWIYKYMYIYMIVENIK